MTTGTQPYRRKSLEEWQKQGPTLARRFQRLRHPDASLHDEDDDDHSVASSNVFEPVPKQQRTSKRKAVSTIPEQDNDSSDEEDDFGYGKDENNQKTSRGIPTGTMNTKKKQQQQSLEMNGDSDLEEEEEEEESDSGAMLPPVDDDDEPMDYNDENNKDDPDRMETEAAQESSHKLHSNATKKTQNRHTNNNRNRMEPTSYSPDISMDKSPQSSNNSSPLDLTLLLPPKYKTWGRQPARTFQGLAKKNHLNSSHTMSSFVVHPESSSLGIVEGVVDPQCDPEEQGGRILEAAPLETLMPGRWVTKLEKFQGLLLRHESVCGGGFGDLAKNIPHVFLSQQSLPGWDTCTVNPASTRTSELLLQGIVRRNIDVNFIQVVSVSILAFGGFETKEDCQTNASRLAKRVLTQYQRRKTKHKVLQAFDLRETEFGTLSGVTFSLPVGDKAEYRVHMAVDLKSRQIVAIDVVLQQESWQSSPSLLTSAKLDRLGKHLDTENGGKEDFFRMQHKKRSHSDSESDNDPSVRSNASSCGSKRTKVNREITGSSKTKTKPQEPVQETAVATGWGSSRTGNKELTQIGTSKRESGKSTDKRKQGCAVGKQEHESVLQSSNQTKSSRVTVRSKSKEKVKKAASATIIQVANSKSEKKLNEVTVRSKSKEKVKKAASTNITQAANSKPEKQLNDKIQKKDPEAFQKKPDPVAPRVLPQMPAQKKPPQDQPFESPQLSPCSNSLTKKTEHDEAGDSCDTPSKLQLGHFFHSVFFGGLYDESSLVYYTVEDLEHLGVDDVDEGDFRPCENWVLPMVLLLLLFCALYGINYWQSDPFDLFRGCVGKSEQLQYSSVELSWSSLGFEAY